MGIFSSSFIVVVVVVVVLAVIVGADPTRRGDVHYGPVLDGRQIAIDVELPSMPPSSLGLANHERARRIPIVNSTQSRNPLINFAK